MRVIARAYRDRPLDRVATGKAAGVTYILNPSAISSTGFEPDSGVGFPDSCVFSFDQRLFESLEAAFAAGDERELDRLWHEAEPIQLPLGADGRRRR